MVRRPSVSLLPEELARAARTVGERFAAAGERVWIVGGAVRDLALGLEPHDLDLCSALAPEAVERLFPRAVGVGRAFGTLVLPLDGASLQHTSFRSEEGYSDARRPDAVRFGRTLEEDARRRDFTCNALYLEPLQDELRDPEGGLADLAAGLLRCVGDPGARLSEDGLRLLRLARFAAGYRLRVEPATAAAAPGALGALVGVSPERIALELERCCERPGAAMALGLMAELGILEVLRARFAPALGPGLCAPRIACLERLEEPVAFPELLALVFDAARPALAETLEGLRLSRATRGAVLAIREAREDLGRLETGSTVSPRAARVRLVRRAVWPSAARLARACGEHLALVAELERLAARLGPAELRPPPLLASADLAAAAVPRGPRWSELLREAEDHQLEGRLSTRAEALAWLREVTGGAG